MNSATRPARSLPHNATIALVTAAGSGQRFGSDIPKVYTQLGGCSILSWAIRSLMAHPDIHAVQPVIRPEDEARYRQCLYELTQSSDEEDLSDPSPTTVLLEPIFGGNTRIESVYAGLKQIASITEASPPNYVIVHDGARPLVSKVVLGRVLQALAKHSSVVPALPIHDAVKQIIDEAPSTLAQAHTMLPRQDASSPSIPQQTHGVSGSVDRSSLLRVQTPQGFCFSTLMSAHEAWRAYARSHANEPLVRIDDDADLMTWYGQPTVTVAGDPRNIKLTRSEDLPVVEAMMSITAPSSPSDEPTLPMTRVATGFDVHRLIQGDGVLLGGTMIPCAYALLGHSDADVLLHAITDAVLGVIGEGDIGAWYPPTDPTFRNASSSRFLREAIQRVHQLGGRITFIDATVICETPKIGPHRQAIRESIASIVDLDPRLISVKATTTEGLGFTGRNEGIAVNACVTALMNP